MTGFSVFQVQPDRIFNMIHRFFVCGALCITTLQRGTVDKIARWILLHHHFKHQLFDLHDSFLTGCQQVYAVAEVSSMRRETLFTLLRRRPRAPRPVSGERRGGLPVEACEEGGFGARCFAKASQPPLRSAEKGFRPTGGPEGTTGSARGAPLHTAPAAAPPSTCLW